MPVPSSKHRLTLVSGGRGSEPAATLIGRADVLERIEREVRGGARLLTILGPPGMGKTTVALASLARLADAQRPAGGAHFCDLSQARTTEELLFATLSLFAQRQQLSHLPHTELSARVAETLAALGPALLVLDNFEQLAFAADVIHGWARAAPRLVLIVTSRERLAVAGEVVIELTPLSCPQAGDAEAAVNASEAVRLFVARARAAGGDPGSSASALAAIVCRLEGIPLAIELAAARTRLLTTTELARRLEAGLEVLGAARGETRHATLAKAIDWSWTLLTVEEQRALARCSVFAGSFTPAAVEQVGGSLDVIGALRDKSLIHAAPGGRLALYVSIRDYAAKKLAELEDEAGPRLAHARHLAEASRRANEARSLLRNDPAPDAFEQLHGEKENLTAALTFVRSLLQEGDIPVLQSELAIAVASLYALPGDACIDALSTALAALRSSGGHAAEEASVLLARQLVWSALGRHEECLRDLAELRIAPETPAALRTLALVFRGIEERYWGDAERALKTHEEADRELAALNLRRARAMNDACTGRLHCDLRNPDAARAMNGRAISDSEATGDQWLSALALANLAQLEQEEGNIDRAESLIGDALDRLRGAGEAHYAAIYAGVCGDLAFERGLPEAARASYAEGAHYFGSRIAHRQAGVLHAAAAALEASDGKPEAAAGFLEVARRCAARSGNAVVRQVVLAHQGTVEVFRASPSERPTVRATWKAWRSAPDATSLAATSMDVRFAVRMLDRALGSVATTPTRLRLAADASWCAVGPERIDLGRRGSLRRILVALCTQHRERPGEGLAVLALVETGWPGERVLVDAAGTRVRVAVATLRRLGLRSVLVTHDDGYLLDPRLEIEWLP